MPIDVQAAQQLWDAFRKRWPIDTLKAMPIEQYSRVDDKDTFTYWLESKTENLGSIWGGSSFKFGIYHRGSDEAKPSGRGRIFGEHYAWYGKYGTTPEEAYKTVRDLIVRIAEAARDRRFQDIESFDLGPAVKWKIAFLYQPTETPAILPIFKQEILLALTGQKQGSYPELSRTLLSKKGAETFYAYASQLWEQGKAILDQKLLPEKALDFLQKRFSAIKEPVKYMSGFETESGRQIG